MADPNLIKPIAGAEDEESAAPDPVVPALGADPPVVAQVEEVLAPPVVALLEEVLAPPVVALPALDLPDEVLDLPEEVVAVQEEVVALAPLPEEVVDQPVVAVAQAAQAAQAQLVPIIIPPADIPRPPFNFQVYRFPRPVELLEGFVAIWLYEDLLSRAVIGRNFSYFKYAKTRNHLLFRGVDCTYGQIRCFHQRMINPIEHFPRRLVTGTLQFDRGMRAYARQLDDFIHHRAPEPPRPW